MSRTKINDGVEVEGTVTGFTLWLTPCDPPGAIGTIGVIISRSELCRIFDAVDLCGGTGDIPGGKRCPGCMACGDGT